MKFNFALLSLACAVKFELPATSEGNTICISQYMAKDILSSVTVDVGNGGNQKVSILVKDKSPSANQFYSKPDLNNNNKFAFTTHEWADVDFCFTNTLNKGKFSSLRPRLIPKCRYL